MDEFLTPGDDTPGNKRALMIVGIRAKTSAELEARETAMRVHDETLDGKLPIPFYAQNDAGKWELEPSGDYAEKVLAELRISEDEYAQLMERPS